MVIDISYSESEARKEIEELFNRLNINFKNKKNKIKKKKLKTDDYKETLELIKKDLLVLNNYLIEFQNQTKDLCLFPYMESFLNNYIKKLVELECLIENKEKSLIYRKMDEDELLKEYKKVENLLNDIYKDLYE